MTNDGQRSLTPEFFNQEMANSYDEKNAKLSAIADNMHFLIGLVLADLPPRANILCVGAGTGAEILSLAMANTEWSFVAADPSAPMLGVCRDRLERANILDRCELIHGYAHDVPEGAAFDAVLSILVAHFVERQDRTGFYRNIHDRLKPGGRFVSTEISYDLDSDEFPTMLKNWERVQKLMGATPESLQTLQDTLRNKLCVLSAEETDTLLKATGFDIPAQFFQAFLIRGCYATKHK